MRDTEIIIIGGGPGGYEIAAGLASKGRKVILIEKDRLGGTCLNRGCIPTKCLCASAARVLEVAAAGEFGVEVTGFKADYGAARARAESVMGQLRSGVEQMLAAAGVEVIQGEASLTGGRTVRVNGEDLKADKIILATGSKPASLDIEGAPLAISSDDFLSLDSLPGRIAIIGGGVIGLEFASIAAAFGCEVTVIEYCREILPNLDSEMAKRLRTMLGRRGIKFVMQAAVKALEPGVRVICEGKRGRAELECDMAVIAVGRKAVLPDGCRECGIELDGRGFIKTDEMMQTTVAGIYAVGDVNGRCMLAHAASAQARKAVGEDVRLDIVPSAVFTMPELASVGIPEETARQRDYDVMVGKASYASNGKALAEGASDGSVKLIFDRLGGQLLGGTIVGAHASDLIAEVAALLYGLATRDDIAVGLVHGHPTLSEIIAAAAKAAR